MSAKLLTLPRGGKVYQVRFKALLTRYDLVAAMLFAWKRGEKEVTRTNCMAYAKTLLREYGIEGLIQVYNKGTADERVKAQKEVTILFPELVMERKIKQIPTLRIHVPQTDTPVLQVAAL